MKMLVTVLGVALMLVPVLSTHNSRGSYAKPQEGHVQALESVTASEVEYVDGPLAPLYDFLIQKRLQRFCKLLRDAKVEDVIQNLGGSWTLFAPTDSSFIFLPGGTLEELQANPEMMRDFILYHFVAGDLPASEIQNELLADSVQGSPLRFNIYEQVFTVSGAQILESDLQFELGRVHIVDHPLYPIPSTDIVNYLQNNYREIYKLLLDTGLTDYVSSGTFTFLVPDDPSFNFLSVELKDALAANTSLAEKILLNHILPGSIYIGGITDGMQWQTVGGNVITFTIKRGLTFANGIPIIFPDVPMTNGVIHILNRVLLPEDVEVDCQCKPSSDSSRNPSREVPGRQDQRPPFGQVTTTQKPAGQFFQKPTQRPASQQPAKTPQRSRPGSQVSSQMTPQTQNQPGRAPFIPSRTRQPSPGSAQTPGSSFEQPAGQVLPEDDTNTVLGPDRDNFGSQKRPDQTPTTRYPPFQRRGPNTHPQQNRFPTSSTTIRDSQPDGAPDNNLNGQDNDRPSQVSRQPSRWTNRQPTASSRYPPPPPPRNAYRTTAKPFQTTRPYGWGQARATQPSIGAQPESDGNPELPPVTENENQFQTNKPTVKTTSWQVRKQPTRAPWQSTQQRTTYRPSRVTPTQRRPIQPRPTVTPTPSSTNAPFESSRQRPACRQRSDRVTSLNQNLPVCTDTNSDDCQNLPYNPSDPRPLCPETDDSPNCREANEPFNPLDTRPLCPTAAQPGTQNCRNSNQPAYTGDRRPSCPLPTTAQSGCRDSSTPFNPTDTRPLCSISGSQNIPPVSPQSPCKKTNEVAFPDDNRPFCQDEPQQDCRPFLERPKPGDRRPVCKVNRQPPSQSQKPVKVTQPPRQSYPQGSRQSSFQTTRRQNWQPTTQPPQNQLNPVNNVRQPQVGKRPQTSTASQPLNPVAPDSFQSRPQTGSHQPRPTSGFQPQIGAHQTIPPTELNPPQTQPQSFQPQTGTQTFQPSSGPLRPQSELYPPAPPSGSAGFQPQSPSSVNQPQTNPNLGSYPSNQQTGSQRGTPIQTPSQRPNSNSRPVSPNRPTSGTYPSTNQRTPGNTQGQQIGSFTPGPSRGTSVSRKPISVTGTSTTPGEDTRRTLYEIVEDPALLIRGHPVKLTKILLLFQKAGIEDLLTGPGMLF